MVTVYEKTDHPRCLAIESKDPAETWNAFHSMYPGSCKEPRPRFPRNISVDNGGEWEGAFRQGVLDCGGKLRQGPPRRSRLNSRAEKMIRDVQEGASAMLSRAKAPHV